MLKVVVYIGNGLGSKHVPVHRNLLWRQTLLAHISTNTAINKSLRRSQYDTKRTERRRTGLLRNPAQDHVLKRAPRDEGRIFGHRTSDVDGPRERRPRPNHQQRIDFEDIGDLASVKENQKTQRRLRKPLRRNEKGEFDRSTRGAKYNYKSKPEGNRALRRALKFGHKVEPAALGLSNSAIRRASHRKAFHGDKNHTSEKDLFDRTPRRPDGPMHHEEQERGPSMPEELQDDIGRPADPRPQFSIRRHLDRPDRTPYVNRTMGNDYGQPGRASSRTFEGHGRDLSQVDDQRSTHRDSNVPLSIPYTTPASEFLYGTSVITAALLSSRRKLYKLYIYSGDNREVHEQDKGIRELALKRGVVVERVKGDWLRLMDKMSTGRPHNGYILEASPLPKLPVAGFRAVEKRNGAFHVILDHQSREDEAVNGTSTNIKYEVGFPRYPFVLLLDGILDPGNLGAILRTAFFLGVDTVAISNRSSAPVSPVALKASAGASETLPLVSISQPGNFIDRCKSNGWKIYASAAPTPGKRIGVGNYFSTSNLGTPVRNHPCLLIIGGEGEGLHCMYFSVYPFSSEFESPDNLGRPNHPAAHLSQFNYLASKNNADSKICVGNIQRKADFDVGIDGPRIGQGKVDSLNVSVAAGLLCEAFLRKPAGRREVDIDAPFDADAWITGPLGVKVQVENRVF